MGQIPDLWEKAEATSREEAVKQASTWASQDPANFSWSPIAPTGSMKKSGIDENCLVLMKKADGKDVKKGELVIYKMNDKWPNVIHRVDAVNDRAFIPNGTANGHYDGWQNRDAIHKKVVKIIRFPAPTPDTSKVLASPKTAQ